MEKTKRITLKKKEDFNGSLKPLPEGEKIYTVMQSASIAWRAGYVGVLFGNRKDFVRNEQILAGYEPAADIESIEEAMCFIKETVLEDRSIFDEEGKLLFDDVYKKLTYNGYHYILHLEKSDSAVSWLYRVMIYNASAFDEWVQKTSSGIRFITPHYKPLFRLKDGGTICIRDSRGEISTCQCRYLDEYHFTSSGYTYHICEFAEFMERAGNVVEPLEEDMVILDQKTA